jgi:hypothetical protein
MLLYRYLSVGLLALLVMAPSALAQQRGNIIIKGPGFNMERKQGWFGTQQNVYSDMFGNNITQKQGLFGRRSTEGQFMGAKMERDWRGTRIKDPGGNVIMQRRRGWFGREDTTIDANGLFQRMKGVFNSVPTNNSDPGTGN